MADRQLVAAEPIHAELLADDLFPITAREARLLTGKPPLDALLESSPRGGGLTYLIDGVPASMAGVRPIRRTMISVAAVVSTPRIYRRRSAFFGSPAPWPKSGWSGSMSSGTWSQRERPTISWASG